MPNTKCRNDLVLTDVIRVLPSMSNLQIMIVDNQPKKPVEHTTALSIREAVNTLDMISNGVQTLPPSYRISSYHGMHGSQISSNIFW